MATFHIKKEELEIAKKWIQTGEVTIYRQTITVEENFTVPIKREELVIKKFFLANSVTPEYKDKEPEVIRILLNEEHVEFTKHKVNLEDVSIYKHQIQDIRHIEETLKTEYPIVKISDSLEYKPSSS